MEGIAGIANFSLQDCKGIQCNLTRSRSGRGRRIFTLCIYIYVYTQCEYTYMYIWEPPLCLFRACFVWSLQKEANRLIHINIFIYTYDMSMCVSPVCIQGRLALATRSPTWKTSLLRISSCIVCTRLPKTRCLHLHPCQAKYNGI